jgi:acetone carboxylase gamma subunit
MRRALTFEQFKAALLSNPVVEDRFRKIIREIRKNVKEEDNISYLPMSLSKMLGFICEKAQHQHLRGQATRSVKELSS